MKILGAAAALGFVGAYALAGGGKAAFELTGKYVEGCSCAPPCGCELTGVEMGCEGVGMFQFDTGSFNGKSISGTKTAYAVAPGEWVIIYIDAPTQAKRDAATAFMKTALAGFGKIEAVKNAKITITGTNGTHTATIGDFCVLKTKPVIGGDGKTPLTISNIHNPIHPTVMQARTVSCTYNDGGHSFKLEDSNAYYNLKLKSKGSL